MKLLINKIAFLAVCLFTLNITAQDVAQVPSSGSTSITTCNALIYDNGGSTGNYTNNSNGTLTIYPGTSGYMATLTFTEFSIGYDGDYLAIYDGPSTTSKFLGKFSYPYFSGTLCASNPTGALTLRFYSNSSTVYSGFSARTGCTSPSSILQQDLTITYPMIDLYQEIAPNKYFSVRADIANIHPNNMGLNGFTAYADSTTLGVYLTTDSNSFYSNSMYDIYLATVKVPTVFGNGSSTVSVSGILPYNLPVGRYYWKLIADYNLRINEYIEYNNTYISRRVYNNTQPTLPDLTLKNFTTLSPIVGKGGQLQTNIQDHNIGNAYASSHNIGYYLSTNNSWEYDDVLLGTSTSMSLNTGDSLKSPAALTIPTNTIPGKYYLIAKTNYQNSFAELTTNNNTLALPITVLPEAIDLRVKTLYVANASGPLGNSKYKFSLVEENIGVTNAPYHTTMFLLSKDSILDANDTYLVTKGINAYASKTETSVSVDITLPNTTPLGTYYIIANADYDNVVTEMNENNNAKAVKIMVVPAKFDLQITGLVSTPSNIIQGDMLETTITEYSKSEASAYDYQVDYYVSNDTVLDASDLLASTVKMSYLSAEIPKSTYRAVTVPQSIKQGSYYLIAVTDTKNAIVETNENNNTRAMAFNITANSDIDLNVSGSFADNTSSATAIK